MISSQSVSLSSISNVLFFSSKSIFLISKCPFSLIFSLSSFCRYHLAIGPCKTIPRGCAFLVLFLIFLVISPWISISKAISSGLYFFLSFSFSPSPLRGLYRKNKWSVPAKNYVWTLIDLGMEKLNWEED